MILLTLREIPSSQTDHACPKDRNNTPHTRKRSPFQRNGSAEYLIRRPLAPDRGDHRDAKVQFLKPQQLLCRHVLPASGPAHEEGPMKDGESNAKGKSKDKERNRHQPG